MVQAPEWTTAGSEDDDLVGGHRELGQFIEIAAPRALGDPRLLLMIEYPVLPGYRTRNPTYERSATRMRFGRRATGAAS